LTQRGGEITIRALELGAFDFITKPTGGDYAQNRESIRNSLAPLLKAYIQRRSLRTLMSNARGLQKGNAAFADSPATATVPVMGKKRPDMVLIGVSTGGPSALSRVIPELPADLGVPVFVVQHMPAVFTRSLAERLNKQSLLTVKDAENDELALPNVVYFAPGGKQMKLAAGPGTNPLIQITDDPPENNCKPSADTLFRSAAQNFPGRACAVIMTGMGSDGTQGLRLLKENKAWVIAQDEASCVIFGMPKEAIDAGVVDIVTPLYAIASEICKSIQGVLP
jgi:two-component system chemotaxis response regulator CheB